MNDQKTLPIIRVLWFAVSIISTIWFLYWISYEALAWNKLLMQATPINYIALVLSIALLIIGTQLGKISIFKNSKLTIEQNLRTENSERTQMQHQPQHNKEKKKQKSRDSEAPSGCKFYLGYLHKRPESVEIPEECMGCDQMVNCLLK